MHLRAHNPQEGAACGRHDFIKLLSHLFKITSLVVFLVKLVVMAAKVGNVRLAEVVQQRT